MELPSITQNLRVAYWGKRVMLCRLYPWTLLTCQGLWSGAHLPWNKWGVIPTRSKTIKKKYSLLFFTPPAKFQAVWPLFPTTGPRILGLLSFGKLAYKKSAWVTITEHIHCLDSKNTEVKKYQTEAQTVCLYCFLFIILNTLLGTTCQLSICKNIQK